MHSTRKRLAVTLGVFTAATAMVAGGTTQAGASPAQPTKDSYTLKLTWDTASTRSTAVCKVNTVHVNRFEECSVGQATVHILRNRTEVGQARFTIRNQMTLKLKSLKWTETVAVSKATLINNAGGIKVGFSVSPTGRVKATNRFPQGKTLGAPFHGTVAYQATVAKHKKISAKARYTWSFTKAGYTPAQFTFSSPSFRCDDTFYSRANPNRRTLSPGCVWTQATPVVDMSGLTEIAKGIRKVQNRGAHYGKVGSGKPLHRLADETKANQNRNQVCPPSQRPPHAGLSCDEYPFATTREGGKRLAAINRGTRWVPENEQDRQGGILGTFIKKMRVLDGDAYYVHV